MPGVRWNRPISMNCLTTATSLYSWSDGLDPRLEDVPKSLLKTIRVRCPPCTGMPAGVVSPTAAPSPRPLRETIPVTGS